MRRPAATHIQPDEVAGLEAAAARLAVDEQGVGARGKDVEHRVEAVAHHFRHHGGENGAFAAAGGGVGEGVGDGAEGETAGRFDGCHLFRLLDHHDFGHWGVPTGKRAEGKCVAQQLGAGGGKGVGFDANAGVGEVVLVEEAGNGRCWLLLELNIGVQIFNPTVFPRHLFLDIAHQIAGVAAAGDKHIRFALGDDGLGEQVAAGKIGGGGRRHNQDGIKAVGDELLLNFSETRVES